MEKSNIYGPLRYQPRTFRYLFDENQPRTGRIEPPLRRGTGRACAQRGTLWLPEEAGECGRTTEVSPELFKAVRQPRAAGKTGCPTKTYSTSLLIRVPQLPRLARVP